MKKLLLITLLAFGLNSTASDGYWNPNGLYYASFLEGDIVQIYEAGGNLIGSIENVEDLEWQPNGNRFVTLSPNFVAQLYNVEAGMLVPIGASIKEVDEINWSPDGTTFEAVSDFYSNFGRKAYTFKANGDLIGIDI